MSTEQPVLLITGGAGYVGSTLIRDALSDGYFVKCVDSLVYGGQAIIGFLNHPRFSFVRGDIRDMALMKDQLQGVDYVIHLAAIVGDKPCQAAPESTLQINFHGTRDLAELSRHTKVKKFLFGSTCSNYGISNPDSFATEDSSLNPVSLYAETKIDCERVLQEMSDEHFGATSVRFGTAFGLSFRTRFDLAVNSFAFEAWKLKEIVVFAADTWRPYIHVADMSVILRKLLRCQSDQVSGQIFNGGATSQNFMKRDMVKMLEEVMPELKTKYIDSVDDRRDYRVSCAKLERQIDFVPTRTVKEGFIEILSAFSSGILSEKWYEANTLDALTEFFRRYEREEKRLMRDG